MNGLIAGTNPSIATIPPAELTVVLERLKTYAKRVHRTAKQAEKADNPARTARREFYARWNRGHANIQAIRSGVFEIPGSES
jgi:hypothetical protein